MKYLKYILYKLKLVDLVWYQNGLLRIVRTDSDTGERYVKDDNSFYSVDNEKYHFTEFESLNQFSKPKRTIFKTKKTNAAQLAYAWDKSQRDEQMARDSNKYQTISMGQLMSGQSMQIGNGLPLVNNGNMLGSSGSVIWHLPITTVTTTYNNALETDKR